MSHLNFLLSSNSGLPTELPNRCGYGKFYLFQKFLYRCIYRVSIVKTKKNKFIYLFNSGPCQPANQLGCGNVILNFSYLYYFSFINRDMSALESGRVLLNSFFVF